MNTPTALSSSPAATVQRWARALLSRYAALFEASSPQLSAGGVLSPDLQRWLRDEPPPPERQARARALDVELAALRAQVPARKDDPQAQRWHRLLTVSAQDDLERDLLVLLSALDLSPRVAATARSLAGWPDSSGLERGFLQAVLDPDEARADDVARLLRPGHPLIEHGVVRGLRDEPGAHAQFLDLAPAVLTWLSQGPAAACSTHDHLAWLGPDLPADPLWAWDLVRQDVADAHDRLQTGAKRLALRAATPEDAAVVAHGLAHRLGRGLLVVDGQAAVQRRAGEAAWLDGQLLGELLRVGALLATLQDAVLLVAGVGLDDGSRTLDLTAAVRTLKLLPVPVLIDDAVQAEAASAAAGLARDLGAAVLPLRFPARPQRLDLWRTTLQADEQRALGEAGLERLAGFPLTPAQIVAVQADRHRGGARCTDLEALAEACRERVGHRVGDVAQRVTQTATWEQVVLPDPVLSTVHEMIAFARHGDKVLNEWGFAARYHYGLGLTSLFSGPPGTGKTMLAGLIARELGLDLFRVDLSRVLSKYIGETEQRLGRLFEEGKRGGVALLFDEADSLFARRTEVKTSVDRYANLEVNFLLQKMEEYSGVVILTTNFADSIDEAFKRRIRFHVQFPVPGEKHREDLWLAMIPKHMPVDDDLGADLLAKAYEFTGGEIKNAVLRAAFYAAVEGTPLTLELLDRAAQAECQERGRLILRTAVSML